VTQVEDLVSTLRDRGLTVAVAESLTGGLLIAEFVSVAGVSAVLLGGVVAYSTELKHSILGVDADLLAEHGPVHQLVAEQMADRVRSALAVAGRSADVGLATTGVAGPGAEGGHPAGTVWLGAAVGDTVASLRLSLDGDRRAIRQRSVSESLLLLKSMLG
jgi:nicotinamide-nucleotide amidase